MRQCLGTLQVDVREGDRGGCMRRRVLVLGLESQVRKLEVIREHPSWSQLAGLTVAPARDTAADAIERVWRAGAARESVGVRVALERVDEVLDVGGRRRARYDRPLVIQVDADELRRVLAVQALLGEAVRG